MISIKALFGLTVWQARRRAIALATRRERLLIGLAKAIDVRGAAIDQLTNEIHQLNAIEDSID